MQICYLDELFYLLAMSLTKTSILLFYLRVFPNHNLGRWIKLTIAVTIVYTLAFIPATTLQCFPIKLAWTRWDKTQQENCTNLHVVGWASTGFHIFTNILVILLPLKELDKFAMSRMKRAGVIPIYSMGCLYVLHSLPNSITNTALVRQLSAVYVWNKWSSSRVVRMRPRNTPISYSSTLEVYVGVVITCLPAFRML